MPQQLTRHYFEVYVEQIIKAAGGSQEHYHGVASLLREFQMKARRDGRHDLIDAVKQTLNACDDRLQQE